ncbi:MAG: type II toxin-antitoxin system RelE/ParE family toxin [Cyclobacteriaceae bacterium]|nr:type II toxin-antitoxin system RelE/ParE family toxin [Cyclobacteriaceae bacterium]
MAKYRFTNKAIDDLSRIWNYTFENWSENQADKYYRQLLAFCKEAAASPRLGKSYEVISESLFGMKANHHIIFYRIIADQEIEIVRILHERMDLKNRLK